MIRDRRLFPAAIGLAMAATILSGCVDAGSGTSSTTPDVDEERCARLLRGAPAEPDAPTMLMVVDHTASAVRRTISPVGAQMLADAQRDSSVLTVLAVDGAGARPREVLVRFPLDPAPGQQAETAKQARAMVPGCVGLWANQPAADPTRPGSDVLAAVNEALRQGPDRLLVSSDGVATSGALDLNSVGLDVDPDSMVEQLDEQIAAANPRTHVAWTDMGATAAPLPESVRTNLDGLWRAVLQRAGLAPDAITLDAAAGAGLDDPRPLPADEVRVPQVETIRLDDRQVFDIPETLLFAPGSTVLDPGSDDVLAPVVDALRAGGAALVVGHSADFGAPDYQHRISLGRAVAVRDRLTAAGVGSDRIAVEGRGSADPEVPEWVEGRHDLTAAQQNRRVVVTVQSR